jgi:pyruvate dehydrogenase E2 component (dihydrolipoamide acetyltransferase)
VPIEVKMAKLSPTMESGQMVKWLVKVGDTVKEGDTLAEIQTDKAVMPMESFDEGVVAVLDVKEGDDIALGQRVLLLASKGEDPAKVAEAAGGGKAEAAPAAKESKKPAETKAPAEAEEAAVPKESKDKAESEAEEAAAGSNGQESAGGRVKSTPLARKIAAAAGADLGSIHGSGPAGRVIRRDVEAFLSTKAAGPEAKKAAPGGESGTATPPAPTRPKFTAAPGETVRIPHTPMRKTIAKRMMESKQALPEIHVTVDIRLDKVVEVREALNKRLAAEQVKLSVGDFITKAVAIALRIHPGLNASYEADAIVIHPEVNVGIAVAIEGGLMVPVVHNADALGLREIRVTTEALAAATRAGTLKPKQMMGGTFSISNLGMYGIKHFDAIINLPEVAILAVGAAEKRPVVEGDTLVVGTVMTVTLTADHRAVDGALAAEFLRTLKGLLEEPASMLL